MKVSCESKASLEEHIEYMGVTVEQDVVTLECNGWIPLECKIIALPKV